MRNVVIGVLVGALALAGCSSSSSPGPSSGSSPSSSGPSSSSSSTSSVSSAPASAPAPDDVAAAPSAGCGTSTAVAGETTETMTSGADERWYLQHVPSGYDPTVPTPVVLDFHGYSEGAEVHAQMSALGPFGEREGFVTITPQGIGAVAEWLTEIGSRDLAFVGDLLDEVEADLCVDTNRVFSTGLSNGARLTSAIACVHGDRIAAAATVAGVRRIEGCTFTRPVPVVALHGTADDYVPYDGGVGQQNLDLPASDGSGRTYGETLGADELAALEAANPPTPDVVAAWAERNGCDDGTTESEVGPDVTRIAWDCPADGTTELYRITDGGHTWPGSELSAGLVDLLGPTTTSVDANAVMWAFFEAHPLP